MQRDRPATDTKNFTRAGRLGEHTAVARDSLLLAGSVHPARGEKADFRAWPPLQNAGGSRAHYRSDLCLFRDLQGVIYLDAKVANC